MPVLDAKTKPETAKKPLASTDDQRQGDLGIKGQLNGPVNSSVLSPRANLNSPVRRNEESEDSESENDNDDGYISVPEGWTGEDQDEEDDDTSPAVSRGRNTLRNAKAAAESLANNLAATELKTAYWSSWVAMPFLNLILWDAYILMGWISKKEKYKLLGTLEKVTSIVGTIFILLIIFALFYAIIYYIYGMCTDFYGFKAKVLTVISLGQIDMGGICAALKE